MILLKLIYAGRYASRQKQYTRLIKKIRISGATCSVDPENSTVNLTIKVLRDESLRFRHISHY